MSPLYEYECNCGLRFERIKPMAECATDEPCPKCGQLANRIYSPFHDLWGWILTETSHYKGAVDRWVQKRPSNEQIVDSEKASHTKTVF